MVEIKQLDWSDQSDLWKKVSNEDKARIGYKIGNDGSFFMSYEDFCKYWTILRICRIFSKGKYLKQTMEGFFKNGETSGKTLNELPQYFLEVKGKNESQEVVISCYQSDPRVIANKKKSNIPMGMLVYHCDEKKIIKNGKKFASAAGKWTRESVLTLNMPPGKYMIIPYVAKSGDESPFWIRVFSDDLIELDQVHPSTKGENYENYMKMNKDAIEQFLHKDDVKIVKKKIEPVNNPDTIQWVDQTEDGINVSNNNFTCSQELKERAARTSYSNFVYTKGRNYFEVKIDKTTSPSNILIGVVDKSELQDQKKFFTVGKHSFSYYGFAGKTFNNGASKDYGKKLVEGDVVGVSVDMDKKEIEFYLNHVSLGIAYSNDYVSGGLTPTVTLYAPGDQVTLNPNAIEPLLKQELPTGIIKDGVRIYLKTSTGKYWKFTEKSSSVTESAHRSSIISVKEKDGKFQFICVKSGKCMTSSSTKTNFFEVVELPDSGYSIRSPESKKYMGWGDKNSLSLYSSMNKNTKWFPMLVSENPIYGLVIEGNTVALKSVAHQTYFGYDNDEPSPYQALHDNCKYTVERAGDMFKFKLLSTGRYLTAEDSKDDEFFLSEETKGISLQGKSKYLGINEKGKAVLCETSNDWNSRFTIRSVSSDLIFSPGNQIALKTKLGGYVYINKQGMILVGEMNELSVFTIKKEGNFLKFINKNNLCLTCKGVTSLEVESTTDGVIIKGGDRFIGADASKVYLYKSDNKKETRFYPEDIDDQELLNKAKELEMDSDVDDEESHGSDNEIELF
jgi:hypothetical protein